MRSAAAVFTLSACREGIIAGDLEGDRVHHRRAASRCKRTTTRQTDADGGFRFENLAAGEYRVTLRMPDGFVRTTDDSVVFQLGPQRVGELQFGITAR